MARAKIQINGPAATAATVAIGSTVQFSNDDNGGELTYAWSIIDQPEGAADTLSSGAIENPTLVPMKEGTYLIRLVVNASLGSEAIQTAAVSVLDARTGERIPAATETTETGASKGWALGANRILARALRSSVDGNLVVAITPGGIAAGQIVKLSGIGTINTGFPSQFTATQIVAVNGTVLVSGQVGIVVDGVTSGVLTVGKLVQIRLFGLVPTSGAGSPTVGDRIYLSNAGLPAISPGTVARAIGYVVASSAGAYQWVIDGADAGGVPDGDKGDVTVSGGGGTWAVDALPESRITNLVSDLAAKANTSSLAAIATSGSASDLASGAVPAARMPALTGDVTSSAGGVATTIANAAVTNVKMANMAATTLKGSVGGGSPADLTNTQAKGVLAIVSADVSGLATVASTGSAADLSTGTLAAGRLPALTGDVTSSVGSAATAITSAAVTNAKLANMGAATLKGSVAGGVPADLSNTQAKSVLAIAAADVSGLAAVATSGSASDLGSGTLPAGRHPALTGDVTTSAGSVATTIANDAVANAKLANMANATIKGRTTAGTGDPEDLTIAQTQALMLFYLGQFGNGSDGAAVMDGAGAVPGFSLAGSTYTATRETYFTNLTINVTVICKPAGYPIRCRGTLTNNGQVQANGGNPSGGIGGAFPFASAVLPASANGGNSGNGGGASALAPQVFSVTAAAGGTGTVGAGVNGTNGGAGHGGGGGSGGGNGGSAASNGGAGGAVTLKLPTAGDVRNLQCAFSGRDLLAAPFTCASGGAGGGAGGGIGAGAGASGGAGGGWIAISAYAWAGSGTYEAMGGNGGIGIAGTLGTGGGGGGGAGGGGGLLVTITGSGSPPVGTLTGGSSGAGGAGSGTGLAGGNGGSGGSGVQIDL